MHRREKELDQFQRESWMLFDPHLPVGGLLKFPNGGYLLQFVDAPFAGLKRIGPMLGPDHDQNDIFADFDRAIAMKNQHLEHVELRERALPNIAELLLRHPFVMFEGNPAHSMALRPVSCGTQKRRDSADALGSGTHAIDFRIQGKVFALDTNEHTLIGERGYMLCPARM